LLASRATAVEDDRAHICVISGSLEGVEAPTRNHTPVQYLDLRIEVGGRLSVPVPAAHNGFILVLEGSVLIGSEQVRGRADQVLWMDFPSEGARGIATLAIVGETPSRVLVVSGEPIRERVVAYGPFVMNTEQEIIQAYHDFHSGKFGGPTPAALTLTSWYTRSATVEPQGSPARQLAVQFAGQPTPSRSARNRRCPARRPGLRTVDRPSCH